MGVQLGMTQITTTVPADVLTRALSAADNVLEAGATYVQWPAIEAASEVIAEWARKEALKEAAQVAYMVHYAAECSTDGILGTWAQSRSNTAFEIRNAIRKLGGND